MIPQRVKVKGFLCYKDEQEIGFDGNTTLWMLSGLNGSGKSTIFDAITYSLFGHHRGGGQHSHELINKDSDSLLVEFDFLLDGKAYRTKRTLRRTTTGGARGTQQIFALQTSNGSAGKWMPLEDLGQKREFDAWVADNIGLNYETFTSSVLLLQGKAEKLLDSKPEGRRAVLASIVDLERYEKLHSRADEQRRVLKARLESLKDRLAALPAVAPLELAAADQRIAEAEEARGQARAEVERLQSIEHQSRGWLDLQKLLAQARERWQQAQQLLGDAPAIEKDVERLRELREVLPRLQDIVALRSQVHEAEGKSKELVRARQKAADLQAARDAALKQARDTRLTLANLTADQEIQQKEVTGKLREATVRLERLKEYERQAADLTRTQDELKRLPDDPIASVSRAREVCDVLAALAQTVPLLARFQARRDELRLALALEESARQRQQQVHANGKVLAANVERLKPLAEEAVHVLQQASDQATEARTIAQQARDSLKEITNLNGAKLCRHCGQALTEGHLKEEKRRRSAEVKEVDARLHTLNEALRSARQSEAQVREELAQADRVYQEARLEYRDCQNQMKQARSDVERLQVECAQLHAELPEPYRSRVTVETPADWPATQYPSAAEMDAVRAEAGCLPQARQELREAEGVQAQWARLKAQETTALSNLARLQADLPADHQSVRQEHERLDLEDKSLDANLSAARANLKEMDADIDRLTKEREQAQGQVSKIDAQIKEQELVRAHGQQGVARNLKALPAAWQTPGEKVGLADISVWNKERDDLEQGRTDERGRELQHARLNLDVLHQEKETLEARQDAFPAEARQDPQIIAAALTSARQKDRASEEELGQARQQKALLESYRQQRQQTEEEYLATEGDLNVQKHLADLLGRERLQLYLVRQAERQVVEHANAVLDRLSGGHLYLKLSGEAYGEGSSAKALELEAYNRSTGEKPINVAFLSGSQKFRVAVALALGIGQYASRQHRPIESVIIDEGFGCLDSQGRQVMIQELQNLRSQMRCILLVSHQEEFADAFSDGYHFKLDEGATKVTRIRK